ncbi:hypothetical protein EZV62_016004 [Acer yangbiense]|uniref:DNA helicase n=1 Tax=Acer yangbiense TaxID=1000413 RepID=A0A5C7HN72_9ROSI|nr:hypothetical protein EZV62_016004 [Acer yangbiense]
MANDARPTHKTKDDENNTSKGRYTSGKGSSSMIPSPARKSERLEKRNSTIPVQTTPVETTPVQTTPVQNEKKPVRVEKQTVPIPVLTTPFQNQKKPLRVEKQTTPIPLRRSERSKKPSSSNSSESKKSDKSLSSPDMIRKKEKKEKSVKQLNMETKEVEVSNTREKRVRKRLSGRAYLSMFKETGNAESLNGSGEVLDASDGGEIATKMCDNAEQPQLKCFVKEKLQSPELLNSTMKGRTPNDDTGVERDHEAMSLKRKRSDLNMDSHSDASAAVANKCTPNEDTGVERDHEAMSLKRTRTDLNTDSDASAVVANKDTCIIRDDVTSSPSRCKNEICVKRRGSCLKMQRYDEKSSSLKRPFKIHPGIVFCMGIRMPFSFLEFEGFRVDNDSTKQEFCSCRQNLKENLDKEDRGDLEAVVTTEVAAESKNHHSQQKESFVNFPANGSTNICIICKLGGHLLCCDGKGCKRSCHLSCLDPPLEDAPLGVWHCIQCIRKKIESGVQSLSGVESIWDSRKVDVPDESGKCYPHCDLFADTALNCVPGRSRKQKQYFVKYKGFAHVHNRWVPECQLLEVPSLVSKFNRKNQSTRWKQEWTVPHRLLQRRSLVSPKQHDETFREHAIDNLDCSYEWLVKWCSLGYEHATWELENAPFINSPKGRNLIRDYEDRHKRAKRTSCSSSLLSIEKTNKREKGFPVKLSQLSARSSSGFDVDFVNKLHDYWHKGQNAVVFDDQVSFCLFMFLTFYAIALRVTTLPTYHVLERIAKVISFIFSLLSDCCRPFLIISTSAALHLWDDEFLRLAPSAHVVLYSGTREVRKNIRTLEFYEGGGCIMLQVLITSPEVLVEDLNVLESIGWEAIVVDECQRSKIFSHFEQIKVLSTDMRLLLVSGQLKDSIAEYLNMLSLLNSPSSDDLIIDSNDTIGGLKEKLLKYIAYEGKSDTSRFVEYWVPVQISNMQLEQYCATLLSNSLLLCSPLKSDPVGVLRDILISIRKCCDHPYLVDETLQSLLIKDKETELLDVGIKASGKLQLLDSMLSEMKNRGLRVLILFQAINGSKMGLGDILDDFIRLRFGKDSYERIDGNVRSKGKQDALNNFNKDSERFVFLLETRACLPSITLSSIDTVIIFNSDWIPVNDTKALQKITLDPQFEKIKIFRLYSSCTVEEKVLILAKQDKTPDGYLQNSRPNTSHLLLMWGTLHLFNRLDEFHGGNTPASSANNFFDQSFWKDVVQEFIAILTQTGEDSDKSKFNIILEVKQNLGTYSTDSQLFGESEIEVIDEGLAPIFWKKLLEGKHPCWKYSSGSSQRSRKRVQHVDDLPKKPDDEVVKKHRKVTNNSVHPSSLKPGVNGKIASRDKKGTSGIPAHNETTYLNHDSTAPCLVNNNLEVPEELCDSQESFYLLLKPGMAKLCEVLKLKNVPVKAKLPLLASVNIVISSTRIKRDDAKDMVEKFLEYVMNNHRVNRERPTIVQAFQISLCWTAASLLKQKIDHKESLALAKQYLNFGCNKDEADLVYSKLRCLKDVFLNDIKKLEVKYVDNLHARLSQSKTCDLQKVKVEVEDWSTGKEGSDDRHHFNLARKDYCKSIKTIKKKCSKQMAKVQQKHREKKEGIGRKYEEERARLENKKKTEAAIIRIQSHGNSSMQTDKLKKLDNEYTKQFEELQRERDLQIKNLEAMLEFEVNKVRDREASWMDEVNSWLQGELLHKPTFHKSRDGVQCLQTSEQVNAHDNHESVVPASSHLSERTSSNTMLGRGAGGTESPVVNETLNGGAQACGNPTKTIALPVSHGSVNYELDTVASAEASVSRSDRGTIAGSLGDGQEHGLSPVHSSEEQIYDGVRLSPDVEVLREVADTLSLSDGLETVIPVNAPSSEKQVPDRVESVPDDAGLLEVPETGSSTDSPETVVTVNFSASGEQIPDRNVLTLPGEEILLQVPENGRSGDNLENDSINLLSSIDQIPDGTTCIPDAEALLGNLQDGCSEPTTLTVPDDEVLLQVPENVGSGDNLENDSANPSSSREQIPDITTCMPDDEALSGNLQDGCSDPITLTGMRDGDAAVSGMQIDTRQVEPLLSHSFDAVASDQSNHGAQATEPLAQPQLLISIDSPSGHNPSGLPSVSGIEHQPSNGHIANQIAQAPTVMVEHHVELSDLAVSQSIASFVPNPPIDIPIDGLGTNTCDPRMASVTPGYGNHTVPNVHPGASQFSLPLYRDPLQKELDRLRKETEESVKTHEETKLRLKSDCEREIEEVVTQIRRKYEIKLKETEAEFLTKKREVDANHNKVLMNKILADAFRSKCTDLKQSNAAVQQEVYSSFIQQMARLSSHHHAQRPSALAGPVTSGPPTVTPQTTVAPAVSLQTSLPAGPQTGVQVVHHSSALFSSTPTRPSQSSSVTPPVGHQVGSGLSAPPHLRPFRPSGMAPSHPIPNNPPATSPMLPPHPTQTPLPAYQTLTQNRAHRANTSGGVPSLPNSSLSALELLLDVSNRSGSNPILPTTLPSQSDLHSSFGSTAQPESGMQSSRQANPVQNSGASDVVCLSDDE